MIGLIDGGFDAILENLLIINMNEPPESNGKLTIFNRLKARNSSSTLVKEGKGKECKNVESWCNYHLTTDNSNPLPEGIYTYETRNAVGNDDSIS
jgi:hypothetical protein